MSGGQDRAEDRELEGFAGGLVRHVLYGIQKARDADQLNAARNWFVTNLPDYWTRQRRVIELLDYIGSVRTPARAAEAETQGAAAFRRSHRVSRSRRCEWATA